jgi:hypothetical protein
MLRAGRKWWLRFLGVSVIFIAISPPEVHAERQRSTTIPLHVIPGVDHGCEEAGDLCVLKTP